jgi:hypothetical protein
VVCINQSRIGTPFNTNVTETSVFSAPGGILNREPPGVVSTIFGFYEMNCFILLNCTPSRISGSTEFSINMIFLKTFYRGAL